MLSLSIYIFLSFLFPVVCVLNYAYAYREYFTTMVELTNSAVFRMLCVNSFITIVVLFWLVSRKIFFGCLNPSEDEVVRRAVPLYILECIGAPLYAGIFSFSFAFAFAVLTAVVGILHRVARERTLTVHVVGTQAERVRMLSGLTLFFLLAMPFDLYVVFDVFANRSQPTDGGYLTLQYCAAVMYLQFAVSNLRLVLRLFFTEVIGEFAHGSLAFYVEVLFSLLRSAIFFASFTYVCFVSHAPYSLIRILFNHALVFFKKLALLVQYRSLTKLLDGIPKASEEVLLNDSQCIICYDVMLPEHGCKQLPCGHCYHEQCLRRWFETMSTCPYCREDLMRPTRGKGPKASASGVVNGGRNNANNREHGATAAAATPQPLDTDKSSNSAVVSNTDSSSAVHREDAVLDRAAGEQWQPPEISEVRKEYARYCAKMRRSREKLAQSLAAELKEQQKKTASDVLRRVVSAGDGDSTAEAGTVKRAFLDSAVAAAAAAFTDSNNDDINIAGGSSVNLKGGGELIGKDLKRAEAYKAYEEAVTAAAETLRRRLISIDMSFEE